MSRRNITRSGPIRLAIWFGKGGVGKSTTTLMLSLFAVRAGKRVLAIDLDPECGTSRDFLGRSGALCATIRWILYEEPLPRGKGRGRSGGMDYLWRTALRVRFREKPL